MNPANVPFSRVTLATCKMSLEQHNAFLFLDIFAFVASFSVIQDFIVDIAAHLQRRVRSSGLYGDKMLNSSHVTY